MAVTCIVEGCEKNAKRGGRGLCAEHYHPLKRYPAESLSPEEVAWLLTAADGPRWTDKRNHALIMFLYATGLRIAEALAVQPFDLDLERGAVFVRHGKGDKARKVAIRRFALPTLQDWLVTRNLSAQAPVFCTKVGKPVNDRDIRRMFTRLGQEAGIERHVHAHAMRHSFAVNAAREKVAPALIQRQLGHSNLGTTTRYLSTISADEVIDAFAALDREGT